MHAMISNLLQCSPSLNTVKVMTLTSLRHCLVGSGRKACWGGPAADGCIIAIWHFAYASGPYRDTPNALRPLWLLVCSLVFVALLVLLLFGFGVWFVAGRCSVVAFF
jgi:hypothetical protein